MNDERLTQLRASWQAKHAEANTIIADSAATGEALTRAERLFDERDSIGKQIEARQGEMKQAESLKGRSAWGTNWMNEPVRTLPFSAAGGDGSSTKSGAGSSFSVTGFEPAGFTRFAKSQEQSDQLRMLEEAGPGTVGEKQWQTMQSFEYKRDWIQFIRKGNRYLDGCKTLQDSVDDQGGVLAPAELIARVIGRLPALQFLRSKVTTLTTGRDSLVLPRKQYSTDDIYTTAFRCTWTGEIPSDGTGALAAVNDSNLLGNVEIPVHTAMLNAPVTRNLIEDGAFPIQAWLESELAQVIDLLYENMIATGSGIGQPTGLFTGATNPALANYITTLLTAATSAGFAYDDIINVETDLGPQYAMQETCSWVMQKQSTYRYLAKIKDSNNRPIFARGIQEDGLVNPRSMLLLGYPVVFSSFAPAVSSTTFPICFGDLKGYYLAQRVGFSIQVLDQTKAKANQIELVGRVRFGGKPIEPWRFRILKSNNS